MSGKPRRTHVGGFRLLATLGKGGMGAVFKAEHPRTGAEVAVKVILGNLQERPEVQERFRREVRAMAAVEHPNLVRVLEAGEDDGCSYYVMQLVDGVDLAALIEKRGRLAPELIARVARGLFGALGALHEEGILHRDLKPHNVMLERSGRPLIMDLGLTKVRDMETMTQTGALIGSPRYMPPETLEGKPLDPRADLYQVGLILYECATGQAAVQGDHFQEVSTRILTGDIPDIEDLRPDFPAPLAALIHTCCACDPADRFPDAAAALAALEGRDAPSGPPDAGPGAALPSATPGGPGALTASGARPPRRSRGWLVTVVGLALGALSAGGYWAWRRASRPPEDLRITVGVGGVKASWRGLEGVAVQLVAVDPDGVPTAFPTRGPQAVPPLAGGRSEITLRGLRPGVPYRVSLRYRGRETPPRTRTIPAGFLVDGYPKLVADARRPALLARFHLPVELNLGYRAARGGDRKIRWVRAARPASPAGPAEAPGQSEHRISLAEADFYRAGLSLRLKPVDETGAAAELAYPIATLLEEAARPLRDLATRLDLSELADILDGRQDPGGGGRTAATRAWFDGHRVEVTVLEFLPYAGIYFRHPEFKPDQRRGLIEAIEVLRTAENMALAAEVLLNPSPSELLQAGYGWSTPRPPQDPYLPEKATLYSHALLGLKDSMRLTLNRQGHPERQVLHFEMTVDPRSCRHGSYISARFPGGLQLRFFPRPAGTAAEGKRVLARYLDLRDVKRGGGKIRLGVGNPRGTITDGLELSRFRMRRVPRDELPDAP